MLCILILFIVSYIVQFITIDYKYIEKIDLMKQEILSILKSHPNIDQGKTIAVYLASGNTMIGNKSKGSFGSNGIDLQIYAMVNKVLFTGFINTQDDIFLAIAKKLNSLDIEFAINPVTIRKEY